MSYNDIVQAIADASKDADTLEQVINGEAETQVKSRLGRMIYTLSTISSRINNLTIQANQKLTELQDAINTAAAAGAGANGWTDSLVNNIDNKPLRTVIVEQVESIADLANIAKTNGRTVIAKSYNAPNYALAKPFDGGGGPVIYDASKADINDGGMVINGWVRQADDVKVEYFGARGDGVTDDYQAIQTAANFCAKNSKALLFGDSVYVCNSKVVIDSAATYFKTVRLIGTYRGTGSAAGYAPNIANSGTTILVNGSDFIEVQIKRWFNENIILDGFAIVNTATTIARSAIKLSKGDFANYPEENRYVSNNMFNNIATYGFERSVVFSGNYTKEMAGTSYLWNYFGPTEFNNFYPYHGKNAIVLENATLNRLVVNRSLFFNLSGGAIVTTKKDANSHESVLMCQLNFVHFEDCRGIFRLGMDAAPSDGSRNHVTMIDVTREVCGLYDGKAGSPYGVVINTDLQIKGRHDVLGYLEKDFVSLGEGSTLLSDIKMKARILPDGGKSLSPSRINVDSKSYVIGAQSTKIISVVAADSNEQFDLVVTIKLNDGNKGFKEFRVVGQATSGSLRSVSGIGSIDSNVTITTSSYNNVAIELVVDNKNSESIEVDVAITQNYTGMQNYFT